MKFTAESLSGHKFRYISGALELEGYGLYNNDEKSFVCDPGHCYPWYYETQKEAAEIADLFNKNGPGTPLHYCTSINEKITGQKGDK